MDLSELHLNWGSCRYKGNVYKSYSLARSYRENGKNRKETICKLGKLSEEEVSQWRLILGNFKNPDSIKTDLEHIVLESHFAHLDVAVALEAWNSWELNSIFEAADKESDRTTSLSSLAALLTINRCIDPSSKSRVPSWAKKTTLPLLLNISSSEINPSRIFRELSAIESCKDQIAQHLCKKMLKDSPQDMESLFYDLSSTSFSGARCLLVKWGHCKEGYENHVVLALIVNAKGLPIYWEVLEGGTADATTIVWLLDRLKEKISLAIPIPTMVFDRGMVSDKNLTLIEQEKIKYITAMDKNQIEKIVTDAEFNFSDFKNTTIETVDNKFSDFLKLDDDCYCKEISPVDGRRYVLCFNRQLFKDQKKAREEQIALFESFVGNTNKELLGAQEDREKEVTKNKFQSYLRKHDLQQFITVSLEEKWVPKQLKRWVKAIRSFEAAFSIDANKQLETGRLDGFWLLVTNQTAKKDGIYIQDTRSIVQPYRDKVVIESSFRDIKSFIEISPVHVWKAEHVRAHYTICVLAHLIDRTLTLSLQKEKGHKSRAIIAHERLYEELAQCQLTHLKIGNTKHGVYRFTHLTEEQQELLDRLEMSYLGTEAYMKNLSNRMQSLSASRKNN